MIATDQKPKAAGAWRTGMWSLCAALLLTPLIAMQFTPEIRWTGFDFVAAAMLLGSLAISVELAVRTRMHPRMRVGAIVAIAGALLAIWAHGAVGVV
jgi:hypothetical protein